MTLREFIDVTKKELDEFETFWRNENRKNKENFPLEMFGGDWMEHFNLHAEEGFVGEDHES